MRDVEIHSNLDKSSLKPNIRFIDGIVSDHDKTNHFWKWHLKVQEQCLWNFLAVTSYSCSRPSVPLCDVRVQCQWEENPFATSTTIACHQPAAGASALTLFITCLSAIAAAALECVSHWKQMMTNAIISYTYSTVSLFSSRSHSAVSSCSVTPSQ